MEHLNTFGLEIYASNHMFFQGRCKSIALQATNGGYTFLAHHENVILALIPGITRFVQEDGTEVEAVTGSGFAEMINNRLKIFVHSAEHPEEIDINRAREARERAEEQLRQRQSLAEYHRSKMELARAMVRLKEAGRRR